MTKVSRVKIESEKLEKFINNFWSLITLLENKEEVKNFLKAILTHTEMKMVAKRIQIAKMLVEGYRYQEIITTAKVTNATIAKISNILAGEGEGLIRAISHLQKIEKEYEKERFQTTPDLEKSYGSYFLPEKIAHEIKKVVKKKNKQLSAKK